MSEFQVTEASVNCGISVTHRDLVSNGLDYIFHPAIPALLSKIKPNLLDLIMDNINDENSMYQISLTVKKLDGLP